MRRRVMRSEEFAIRVCLVPGKLEREEEEEELGW